MKVENCVSCTAIYQLAETQLLANISGIYAHLYVQDLHTGKIIAKHTIYPMMGIGSCYMAEDIDTDLLRSICNETFSLVGLTSEGVEMPNPEIARDAEADLARDIVDIYESTKRKDRLRVLRDLEKSYYGGACGSPGS